MQSDREAVCRNIFWILLAQLIFLALWSLVAQSGPVFVQRAFFGYDFREFYLGPRDWLHGINPYTAIPLNRFDKPPFILAFGMLFSWAPFGIAVITFAMVNVAIIVVSVRTFARRLDLPGQCANYLTWIALLYYPVYFLLDRGNLEAVILGCFCWAFCTRSRFLRAVLIAATAGLKIFPLLLLAPAARNRQWRFILSFLLLFVLLLLPFYRLIPSFLHALTVHGAYKQLGENISPAAIIVAAAGLRLGKWIYLVFWAGTLAFMLYRHQHASPRDILLPYIPWMIAFPLQSFPYGAVLLLPVLAWKLHEMKDRATDLWDKIFIDGFLLVGVQATAFTIYFQREPAYIMSPGKMPHYIVFHWMNSLGMSLILIALAFSKQNRNPAAPEPDRIISQSSLAEPLLSQP
jgi:hypothetical protein